MSYLDRSFDGSNDRKLEGLLIGGSLGYTYGKVLGSDERIRLRLSDGKVIGTILGNVDRLTLAVDVGTELGSLDAYFDSSNDDKIGGLLFGESLGYTDITVLGSEVGIKLGSTDGNAFGTIL